MTIKFPGIIERKDHFIVDGYSDKKTEAGAIKDFGRFIEKKFNNGEGQALIDCVKFGESPVVPVSQAGGGYFFEIEEVCGASQFNDETDEMEYADGNFYLVIKFFKPDKQKKFVTVRDFVKSHIRPSAYVGMIDDTNGNIYYPCTASEIPDQMLDKEFANVSWFSDIEHADGFPEVLEIHFIG